jgi:hypothetical protein
LPELLAGFLHNFLLIFRQDVGDTHTLLSGLKELANALEFSTAGVAEFVVGFEDDLANYTHNMAVMSEQR